MLYIKFYLQHFYFWYLKYYFTNSTSIHLLKWHFQDLIVKEYFNIAVKVI